MKLSVFLSLSILGMILHITPVYSQASVTIVQPQDTVEAKFGEQVEISWLNGDLAGNDLFYFYYSVDDGNFTALSPSYKYYNQLTNSGDTSSFVWAVPDLGADSTSEVRIRILNNSQAVADTSDYIRIYFEPSVEIIQPENTLQVKFGDQVNIKWLNGDLVGNDLFYFYYSVDGGNFTALSPSYKYHNQLTNSGDTSSLPWIVPDLGADAESEVRIRILNNNRAVSDTSAEFRVYFEPSVKSISPDATHQLKFGDQVNVEWINGDLIGNDLFYFYYSVDDQNFTALSPSYKYHNQLTNRGDTSSFSWTVPDLGADSTSQVRIRIFNNNRQIADTTEYFKVYFEPKVEIVEPSGVAQAKFGEQLTIKWDNGDLIGNDLFYFYYSIDDGNFNALSPSYKYYNQVTNEGNTSSFVWNVPDLGADSTSQVRIRVYNNTRQIADTSDYFKIYFEPSVKAISPLPGENVLQGTSKKISWDNGDINGNDLFYFYYSVDGGAYTALNPSYKYYNQVTNDGNSSSFNWIAPTIESNDVKIRIYNATRDVADTTEAFTICATCPAVSIYKPNGGEVLGISKDAEIGWNVGTTWQSTDSIRVEYSLDGGTIFDESNPIYAGQYSGISDNTITWNVDATETSQGRIKVSNVTQSASDISDANFTIVSLPAIPTDLVVQENSNQTVTLTWTDNATNEISYRVEYSSDKVNWSNYSGSLAADANTFTSSNLGNAAFWWRVRVYSQYYNNVSAEKFGGGYAASSGETPFGQALSFDGTDDKVTLGDSSQLSFSKDNAFTIEAWVQASVIGSRNTIFGKMANANPYTGYQFQSADPGILRFYLISDLAVNNAIAVATDSSVLADNKWHHVAVTYDGSSDISGIQIYADGNLLPTTPIETSLTGEITNNTPVIIGARSPGDLNWNGQMDEIRVWNTVRTSNEIADNMDSVLVGNEAGLISYYPFDHTSGVIAADKGPNDLNGEWSGPSGANTSPSWVATQVGVDLTPTITVTTPNGGETLTVGQAYNITWTTENIPESDPIEIQLSADGGSTYAMVNDGTFGTYGGTYQWSVPDSVTTSAKIKIFNTAKNVADSSDTDFSIVAPEPTLAVTYPNGGETFLVGNAYTIRWATANIPDTDLAEIRLSTDGGLTYTNLSTGVFGDYDGQYSWVASGTASSTARIQVVNTTQGISDESDANFIIDGAEPQVTVTSPNGGETWTTGEDYTITWNSVNISSTDLIEIRLSVDGGQSYSTLADGNFGMYGGSYTWTVTGDTTSMARIQVANTTQNVTDSSDADFVITAPPASITVTAPSGGEVLNGGQNFTIQWTTISIQDTDSVSIRLSLNNGTYSEITKGTFGDFAGSYEWAVPDTTSSPTWIQIVDTDNNVSDINNSSFTILETPKITLTSPNGGEQWEVGTTQQIRWDYASFGSGDIIEVSISTDGGQTYNVWTSGNYQNGFVNVTVPDSVTNTARIKAKNLQKNIEDESDSNFEILVIDRSISITSPAGGETFSTGQQVTVEYAIEGLIDTDILDIYLSTDGGTTYPYRLLESFVSAVGDTSFVWDVNQPATTNAVLRARVTSRNLEFVTPTFSINTAPAFSNLYAEIIGDSLRVDYSLSEEATAYLVVLENGSSLPTGDSVKSAATGEAILAGQVFANSFSYPTAESIVSVGGNHPFTRQSIYDIYLSAEDPEANLSGTVSILNILAQFTPLEKDSIVVDLIYDNMGGENWTNVADNWIELPLGERVEITIDNNRIAGLDFSDKSLIGVLPQEILQVSALSILDLSNNEIDAIPDMSELTSLTAMDVTGNKLDFGSIIPNYDNEVITIGNQKPFGQPVNDTIPKGAYQFIQVPTTGSGLHYQWEYNDEELSGATSSYYEIDGISFETMGTYVLKVTSDLVSDLELQSAPQTYLAYGSIEFYPSFEFADGELAFVEEGISTLLKIKESGPYDTIQDVAITNSKVLFERIVLGDYLLSMRAADGYKRTKTITSGGETIVDEVEFIPTYFESVLEWDNADTLRLREFLVDTVEMLRIPPPLLPGDGNGTIDMTVESDLSEGGESEGGRLEARRRVRKAGCSLRRNTRVGGGRGEEDDEWELIAYKETDENGAVDFGFLPTGLYRINIQYPGIPMDPNSFIEFSISDDESEDGYVLAATVYEDGIRVEVIEELGSLFEYFNELKVYPNPADKSLVIGYQKLNSESVKYQLVDLNGRVRVEGGLLYGVRQVRELDTSQLQEGIYLLRFFDELNRTTHLATYKIIVQH
jgi:hypothetical protein